MAFRQLDDKKSLTRFLCRQDGARLAVSYKHIPKEKKELLGLRRPRHTATDRQMGMLRRRLLRREMLALKKDWVSIWFDQVHSENQRE